MLRVYRMPNGRKYQYEEGTQPDGAVLVEVAPVEVVTPETPPEAKPPRRRTTRKKEQK